jgi:CheY-like chemotaxis protein
MSAFRLVLVEDTEPDVFLVREALRQAGLDFELQVLEDGEKAIEFVDAMEMDHSAPRPDLVLLDLNLPKKSGGRVLERIRGSSACDNIPVVILTSSESPEDRAQVARFRATRYFRKASRLDEFMKLGPLVRQVLESRNP